MRLSILLLAVPLMASTIATANPNNSNGEKFEFLHAEIMDLRDALTDLSVDSATTSQSIESLESDIEDLTDQLNDLQSQIDMLSGPSGDSSMRDRLVGVASLGGSTCRALGSPCGYRELQQACARDFGDSSYIASFGQLNRGFNRITGLPEQWGIFGALSTEDSFYQSDGFKVEKYWIVFSYGAPSQVRDARSGENRFVACAGPSSS